MTAAPDDELGGLLDRLGLDDVEAAERLLRLEERAIGDDQLRSPSKRTVRAGLGLVERLADHVRAALAQDVGERDVLVDDRRAARHRSWRASAAASP